MRKVYVIGIGQTPFGKLPQYSAVRLGAMAAEEAVKDAGIDPRKLQVAYGGRCIDNGGATPLQDMMTYLGVSGIEMNNVINACGTGITATNLLWRDIAYGIYDIGIAVGADSMTTSSLKGKLLAPEGGDLNGLLGISMPSYFGLIAQRIMHDYGATPEDMAYPSVKNHRNAALNPYAMYKKPLTAEEILASAVISSPIHLLECCPSTDGAAAVILCSEEIARQYTTKLVCVEYSEIASGYFDYPNRNIIGDQTVKRLVDNAAEKTGIDPKDYNLVELHDAFSAEEIYAYESMGLCAPGESIKLMREGYFDLDGKCAVNPSGGLLALGHPIAASGVRVLVDVVRQLRGEAGGYQVKDAKVGVAQMLGGYLTNLVPPIAGGIQIVTR